MLFPWKPKRLEIRCLDLKRVVAVALLRSAVAEAPAEVNLVVVVALRCALYKEEEALWLDLLGILPVRVKCRFPIIWH